MIGTSKNHSMYAIGSQMIDLLKLIKLEEINAFCNVKVITINHLLSNNIKSIWMFVREFCYLH